MKDNRFFLGWTSTPFSRYFPRETDKALMVNVDLGYWGRGHEGTMWIPKSILKVSKPNENNNVEILIPYWWVSKNRYFEKVTNIIGISMVGMYETEEEDGNIFILKDGTRRPFGDSIWY